VLLYDGEEVIGAKQNRREQHEADTHCVRDRYRYSTR
jgi:hypothetical protein